MIGQLIPVFVLERHRHLHVLALVVRQYVGAQGIPLIRLGRHFLPGAHGTVQRQRVGAFRLGAILYDGAVGLIRLPVGKSVLKTTIKQGAALAVGSLHGIDGLQTATVGPQALPGKVVENDHHRNRTQRGSAGHVVLFPVGTFYGSIGIVNNVVVAPVVDQLDARLGMVTTQYLPLGPKVEADGFAGGGVEELVSEGRFGGRLIHIERLGINHRVGYDTRVGGCAPVGQVALEAGVFKVVQAVAEDVVVHYLHAKVVVAQLAALTFARVNG